METQTVGSGAAELAVFTWGTDGPAIVALHPGVADSRIWAGCAPVWVEAGYRAVAYDRRGFGATTYEPEPHDELADLRRVLDATKATPAVLVGNSNGGGLALDLALDSPELVAGLVLVAPSPSGYPYEQWFGCEAEAALDAEIEAAVEAGDLDLVNKIEVRYWLDGVEQTEGRVGGAARELMTAMNGAALRAAPPGDDAEREPSWPRLSNVSVPSVVIAGQYDLPGMTVLCRELAEQIPGSLVNTIHRAAHCPALDQPDALNELVLRFADRVGRKAASD